MLVLVLVNVSVHGKNVFVIVCEFDKKHDFSSCKHVEHSSTFTVTSTNTFTGTSTSTDTETDTETANNIPTATGPYFSPYAKSDQASC